MVRLTFNLVCRLGWRFHIVFKTDQFRVSTSNSSFTIDYLYRSYLMLGIKKYITEDETQKSNSILCIFKRILTRHTKWNFSFTNCEENFSPQIRQVLFTKWKDTWNFTSTFNKTHKFSSNHCFLSKIQKTYKYNIYMNSTSH